VEAFPLKNIRASTVAEVFVSQIISRYGVPLEVHTDQEKNFQSQVVCGIDESSRDQKNEDNCFTSSIQWSGGTSTPNDHQLFSKIYF